jgi:hypothetical protein
MANKKISQLTSAAALTGTELLPVVQDGETVQTTAQNIANLAGLPYKSYVALITHGAGNANPTAQVLYNNIGNITPLYDEPNNYSLQSAGLFTLNKTIIFISSPTNPLMKVGSLSNNVNFVGITTENDGFANLAIEIRVYL